jgi:hypothetical protein
VLALPLAITWLPAQLFRGPTSGAFQVPFNNISEELSGLSVRTQAMLAYQLSGFLLEPLPWHIRLQQGATILALLLILTGFFFAIYHSGAFRPALRWLTLCTLASWLTYYAAGRLGIYPYGGTRHALILSPLILLMIAAGLLGIWRRHKPLAVIGFLAIGIIGFVSPPEPAEDLRTITDYWLQQRNNPTPTYVYYAAVPGFRYQLRLEEKSAGLAPPSLPPLWYIHCWEGRPEKYCADRGVVYGRWIRRLSAAEKQAAILDAFGSPPEEFWLVLSHTGDSERRDVLQILSQNYNIDDRLEVSGAAVYLLSRRE